MELDQDLLAEVVRAIANKFGMPASQSNAIVSAAIDVAKQERVLVLRESELRRLLVRAGQAVWSRAYGLYVRGEKPPEGDQADLAADEILGSAQETRALGRSSLLAVDGARLRHALEDAYTFGYEDGDAHARCAPLKHGGNGRAVESVLKGLRGAQTEQPAEHRYSPVELAKIVADATKDVPLSHEDRASVVRNVLCGVGLNDAQARANVLLSDRICGKPFDFARRRCLRPHGHEGDCDRLFDLPPNEREHAKSIPFPGTLAHLKQTVQQAAEVDHTINDRGVTFDKEKAEALLGPEAGEFVKQASSIVNERREWAGDQLRGEPEAVYKTMVVLGIGDSSSYEDLHRKVEELLRIRGKALRDALARETKEAAWRTRSDALEAQITRLAAVLPRTIIARGHADVTGAAEAVVTHAIRIINQFLADQGRQIERSWQQAAEVDHTINDRGVTFDKEKAEALLGPEAGAEVFSFAEALMRLRQGKHVRRKTWGANALPWRIRSDSETIAIADNNDTPIHAIHRDDLLALDWVEVEPPLQKTLPREISTSVAKSIVASLLAQLLPLSGQIVRLGGVLIARDRSGFTIAKKMGNVSRERTTENAAHEVLRLAIARHDAGLGEDE